MPARTLKITPAAREIIRHLHPRLKRKIRAALDDILREPTCGKALHHNLAGYWSLPVGRHRIVYRPDAHGAAIVAIGPRKTIYEAVAEEGKRSDRLALQRRRT